MKAHNFSKKRIYTLLVALCLTFTIGIAGCINEDDPRYTLARQTQNAIVATNAAAMSTAMARVTEQAK